MMGAEGIYCWCGHEEDSHVGLWCQGCEDEQAWTEDDDTADPAHGFTPTGEEVQTFTDGDSPNYFNLAAISDRAIRMMDDLPDQREREWWGRYAVNLALAASREVEAGDPSQAWKVRRAAALSYTAQHGR